MLTKEQVAEFQTKGCLKGNRVLSDAQVEAMRNDLTKVMENRENANVPQPVSISNWNPTAPIWQIVNIWEASDAFRELLSNPMIVEEVAQLTNAKQLRVWHDQIQYKPAGDGGVNMWHQDWPYWPNIAPMTEQVSAWVALDDVDPGNGCMSMVPGSHLWGNNIDFLHTLKEFKDMPAAFEGRKLEIELRPVKKGEVHYHHGLTWHGSHANTSGRPRRAIAVHYMTEKTVHVASGNHLMKRFIDVPDHAMLQGEHFPLVWDKKAIPVAPIQRRVPVA